MVNCLQVQINDKPVAVGCDDNIERGVINAVKK